MDKGWLKLHRKIRHSPIFNDHKLFRLWVICLTEASHKERELIVGKQIVSLRPGQFVTGRFELRDAYNHGLPNGEKVKGEKTVFRWLELLEKGSYLTIRKTTKFSVVTVLNWAKYQSNDQHLTNKEPSSDQQMTTNKNLKNEKKSNRRKPIYDEASEFYQLARSLVENIKRNHPEAKAPNIQQWADEMRTMVERDQRTVEQISHLIKWSAQHEFWHTVVLSPASIRRNWVQMVAQVKQERAKTGGQVLHILKKPVEEFELDFTKGEDI